MQTDSTTKFPWLTLVLLIVFLVLAWMNFAPSFQARLRAFSDKARAAQSSRPPQEDPQPPARSAATAPVLDLGGTNEPVASGLRESERTNIAIYRAVSPSVVAVNNRTLVRGGFFGLQVFEVPQGSGSGFVWDRMGHIISNYHVVHQATAITVTFADGTSFPATIVGIAPDYDLAVLKIDAPADRLVPVHCGTSRDLLVGQSVLAIGNPFGLDTTLTVGVVSALGRSITAMTERRIHDVIQTDAAINPGNSGGPLLNSRGQLIGVNTAILSPSGAYAGIGFAVPADTVSRVVPQLIARGKVSRAGLGVQLLPDHVASRSGVEGAALLTVLDGGPAARAGLKGVTQTRDGRLLLGDVIVGINQIPVTGVEDLCAVLDRLHAGDTVALTCRREQQTREVRLELQELD